LVVTEAQEYRLAEEPIVGPFEVAHLGDERRRYPAVLAPTRRRARAGGCGPGMRAQRLAHLGEHLLVEPGADAACVDEAAAIVVREVQRAEPGARGRRGHREADDGEVGGAYAADLAPRVGASATVGGVGALGDHPLERQALALLEEQDAVLLDVVAVAQRAGAREHAAQERLAREQRQPA